MCSYEGSTSLFVLSLLCLCYVCISEVQTGNPLALCWSTEWQGLMTVGWRQNGGGSNGSHLSKDMEQPRKAGRASGLAEERGNGMESYMREEIIDWIGLWSWWGGPALIAFSSPCWWGRDSHPSLVGMVKHMAPNTGQLRSTTGY